MALFWITYFDIEHAVKQPINRLVVGEHQKKIHKHRQLIALEQLADEAQLRKFHEHPRVGRLIPDKIFDCCEEPILGDHIVLNLILISIIYTNQKVIRNENFSEKFRFLSYQSMNSSCDKNLKKTLQNF